MSNALSKLLSQWWAKRRIADHQKQSGRHTLTRLLKKAASTRYGRQYGFAEIAAASDPYAAFCEKVPVIDYSDWVTWLEDASPLSKKGPQPLVNQAWPGTIDIFCLSSGTTSGRTKYVPYSQEMARINRRAALDFFAYNLIETPDIAPPGSKTLYMSGSTNLERNQEGALCGDMSGLTKYLAPKILGKLTLPDETISSLEPWEKRLVALIELCLQRNDIGTLSGIPIWQLTLLEQVVDVSGKPLTECMPNLRRIIHGGMSIEPYRDRFQALCGDQVVFSEIYAASEIGIGAYQLPGEQGMRFMPQYDVFYEFEDERGNIYPLGDIRADRPYSLIISSCSGLWRYRIGDVLVFRQTDPAVLAYVGRAKTTSAFDEKVTEKELELAMLRVQPQVADYAMGPDVDGRRHVWFLIHDQPLSQAWMLELDQALRSGNADYDDYRGDGRINPPLAVTVADRAAFLKTIGREEGGQRKFPRLLSAAEVGKLLAVQEAGRSLEL